MTVTLDVSEIRDLVFEVFREFGASRADLADLSETLLIQAGRYYGRSFRTDALMAMWMPEVGVLQIYGADGAMLRTINLLNTRPPARQAA